MLYIHYCKICQKIHILNGHKLLCPKCGNSLTELQISHQAYADMNLKERQVLSEQCKDDSSLDTLSTTYRMHKYSKHSSARL